MVCGEDEPMAATSSCLVSPRSPARSRCCLTRTRISARGGRLLRCARAIERQDGATREADQGSAMRVVPRHRCRGGGTWPESARTIPRNGLTVVAGLSRVETHAHSRPSRPRRWLGCRHTGVQIAQLATSGRSWPKQCVYASASPTAHACVVERGADSSATLRGVARSIDRSRGPCTLNPPPPSRARRCTRAPTSRT